MSSELAPFFPTALHPAIPVAVNLLSTLRNLTAPGKGNDIRAEERAALVGVSALLACEKVHSKDLIERTAQKASSVAPAHFRSALQRARTLLSSQPDDGSTSTSSSRRSPSSRTKAKASAAIDANDDLPIASASSSAPSPFSTPKKKFKFSSGVDISGLMKHSPSKGSPLKQSVTPRRRQGEDERDAMESTLAGPPVEEEEELEEAIISTPTKVRHIAPTGGASTSKRKRDDEEMAAFFALRPGDPNSPSGNVTPITARFQGLSDAESPVRTRSARPERSEAELRRRKLRKKRDWTFREEVWASAYVQRRNKRILQDLDAVDPGLPAPF